MTALIKQYHSTVYRGLIFGKLKFYSRLFYKIPVNTLKARKLFSERWVKISHSLLQFRFWGKQTVLQSVTPPVQHFLFAVTPNYILAKRKWSSGKARRRKCCGQIDFAPIQTFSQLCQVAQLLKKGNLVWSWRHHTQVQTEMVEFIGLLLPLSSKLKNWPFKVVVVQRHQTNLEISMRVVNLLTKLIVFFMFQ